MILVFYGLVWGTTRFLESYPYVFLIGTGLILLACSLLAQPEGLLSYLPQTTQDFLLQTTVFDLLHDNASMTNTCRKWGRAQLLALPGVARTQGSVDRIVRD